MSSNNHFTMSSNNHFTMSSNNHFTMSSNNHFKLCQITSHCLQTRMTQCLQATIPINNLTMFSISNNNFTLFSSNSSFKQKIHIVFKPHSNDNFTIPSYTPFKHSKCFQTPLSHNNFTKSSNDSFKQHIHCVQTHIKKQIIMVREKKLHNNFRFCLLTKTS